MNSGIDGVVSIWSATRGDPRVVVALLDGPVDRAHPSLRGARLESAESTSSASANREGPATRHGTAVASLIFGQHDANSPVRGMAPDCRGLVVPIFDDADAHPGEPFRPACSQLELARAILVAIEHGASIINISAGQFGRAASAEPLLADVVRRAVRRGVLIVAAAGNDGCECSHVPAALPDVLAVGAMDSDGRPLDASNWGAAYRASGLLAPGDQLLAASADGGREAVSGTSFATAIASGAAALLWSLALRGGAAVGGSRIRAILLDSTQKCVDDSTLCRRQLAGRLDLDAAVCRLRHEGASMSDARVADPPGDPAASDATPGAPSRPKHDPARFPSVTTQEGCGCAACQARAQGGADSGSQRPPPGGLVLALGQLGYDLVSEARRDSIAQHMIEPGASPADPAAMLRYLSDNPWEAASITWTLQVDQTPLYAIVPSGPFAAEAYKLLREFLDEQRRGETELISIPGRLGGRIRLLNGHVVPIVVPELRGAYSWSTAALVEAVVGEPPPEDAPDDQVETFTRKQAGVRGFLQRVYYELRNLGVAAEDRAINYAATNAFEVERVFEDACNDAMELDDITVERSPICRPDSDCWDVKIAFFYPERQVQTVRKVYRFTVDVSDVVPVTVGEMRSWFVR